MAWRGLAWRLPFLDSCFYVHMQIVFYDNTCENRRVVADAVSLIL